MAILRELTPGSIVNPADGGAFLTSSPTAPFMLRKRRRRKAWDQQQRPMLQSARTAARLYWEKMSHEEKVPYRWPTVATAHLNRDDTERNLRSYIRLLADNSSAIQHGANVVSHPASDQEMYSQNFGIISIDAPHMEALVSLEVRGGLISPFNPTRLDVYQRDPQYALETYGLRFLRWLNTKTVWDNTNWPGGWTVNTWTVPLWGVPIGSAPLRLYARWFTGCMPNINETLLAEFPWPP